MSKNDVMKKIKNVEFFNDISLILDILEANIDRIEFVKEGLGLENFIFFSEKDSIEFEDNPFYACFDVDVKSENEEFNYISMKKSMIADFGLICNKLINFFKNKNEKFYVWVAFKETSLEQSDMFRVMENLKTKKEISTFEAKAKLRKYPKWYIAKTPNEIILEETSFEQLKEIEDIIHLKNRDLILNQIEESIKNKDEKTFFELCVTFNKIYK